MLEGLSELGLYLKLSVFCMRGSRNFRLGGPPGQSDKKSSDIVVFFFCFFSPQLILQKSNGQLKKKQLSFCKVSEGVVGPTFSRGGGSNFFQGGGGGGPSAYSLIETHITCDFPGGGGPPVPSPLWIRTCFVQGKTVKGT